MTVFRYTLWAIACILTGSICNEVGIKWWQQAVCQALTVIVILANPFIYDALFRRIKEGK